MYEIEVRKHIDMYAALIIRKKSDEEWLDIIDAKLPMREAE
jgi:hypothetical protein